LYDKTGAGLSQLWSGLFFDDQGLQRQMDVQLTPESGNGSARLFRLIADLVSPRSESRG
jgi:hypothetical protein